MVANKAYTRGKSGYSIKDEEEAKKYAKLEKTISEDALRRKEKGEKGFPKSFTKEEVKSRVRSAEQNYKENTKTSEGRNINRKNTEFMSDEVKKLKDVNGHKWKGQM